VVGRVWHRVVARVCVSVALLAGVLVAGGWIAAGQPGSLAVRGLAGRSHDDVRLVAGSGQPGAAPGSSLNAVAASSRVNAWAVGTTSDQSFPANSTLTERWDGVRWTVVPSPSPGGAGRDAVSVLTGVAAVSRTSAWAVGYFDANAVVLASKQALIMHWDGVTWAQVPSPNLPDSILKGITAVSPANVWAVGFTGRHALIEHWNGVRWRRVASPSPFDSALNAVAATSRTSAWAVGQAGRGTLTEHWNGVKWKRVASPSPDRRLGTDLLAVTAVSRTNAWAAGRYQRPRETGLIEHWDGTRWRQVPGHGSIVRGTASAAGGVWAVGSAGRLALIEHRVRGKWTAVRSPVPARAAAIQLQAVTMTSARSGWAAGDYISGNSAQALIERWNGTRWQRLTAPSPGGPTWGTAIVVPGTDADADAHVEVDSVSCASAGNCSAAGSISHTVGSFGPFVVSQVDGTWGTAIEVPGLAALDTSSRSFILSLSCASAGNCSAGGLYTDLLNGSSIHQQAFVVSQVNGTWGTAIEVPGLAALNVGNQAAINSVSCASAGNCSAGGYYNGFQAFVVSEVNGTWGSAINVPGTTGGIVESVSCGSAGSCTAGGSDDIGAFVVSQVNGHWGTAIRIPGLAALHATGSGTDSVSCASAGNCSIVGQYIDKFGHPHVFAASEVKGRWGPAIKVAGLTTPDGVPVMSLSCASAGNCSGGGSYPAGTGCCRFEGFLFSQVNGHWGAAMPIPGLAALHANSSRISSLSCGSAGNCSAVGFYDKSPDSNTLVVDQVNGHWGTAKSFGLGLGSWVNSVSCGSAGKCTAGGIYGTDSGTPHPGHSFAFVVSRG
jgi:hypothetical protein